MKIRVLFDFNNLCCRCVTVKGVALRDVARNVFDAVYSFTADVKSALDEDDSLDVWLCRDSREGYWRQELYPQYKGNRQKARDESPIDWEEAHREFGRLGLLLGTYTPWRYLYVPRCEADDLIYVLATDYDGPTIIHSGDSDYLQLVNDHVSLYMPHHMDYAEFPRMCRVSGADVFCRNADDYLQYAILTGQGGKDNVYNVRTPTNWDTTKRKPPFGVVAAEKLIKTGNVISELVRLGYYQNYLRNKALIDMKELPERVADVIRDAINETPHGELDSKKLVELLGLTIDSDVLDNELREK